jgi:predicted  nucleic acid-binding Zn-ribbon protein
MSDYPNAYCVKCGHHTVTQQKHTVILQSQARALHGKCPECGSDVFKFLPKKSKQGSKIENLKKPRKGATVTSIHDVQIKRRAGDSLTDLENQVMAMEQKQPIDYILMALGAIAAGCLIYLIYR